MPTLKTISVFISSLFYIGFNIYFNNVCAQKDPLLEIPSVYYTPVINQVDESTLEVLSGTVWKVFSQKNDNPTYADKELLIIKERLYFLEPLYVVNRSGDLLHVYSDPEADHLQRSLSNKAVDKGWIPASSLLLWSRCLFDSSGYQDVPLQAMVYDLSDISFLVNHGEQNSRGVTLFSNPELRAKLSIPTTSRQLYYVYKITENAILIGNAERIAQDQRADSVLLGWAPINQCFIIPSRYWLEPNCSESAIEEMQSERIHPLLFIDEQHARIYAEKRNIDKRFVIWESVVGEKPAPEWIRFPLIERDNGMARVRITSLDFITGFTPVILDGMNNSIFNTVTLISFQDLSDVVSCMSKIILAGGSGLNRNDVRRVIEEMLEDKYYDLREERILNMTFSEIASRLFWISVSDGSLSAVPLRKITDQTVIGDAQFQDLLNRIRSREKVLRRIVVKEYLDYSFVSNSIRYFWIDINYFSIF